MHLKTFCWEVVWRLHQAAKGVGAQDQLRCPDHGQHWAQSLGHEAMVVDAGGCWWGGGEDDLCPQQRCFRWHASSETTLQAMLWVCSLATLGRLVQTTFHQPRQKGGAAADCLDASAVLIMLWRSWGALGWLIALGHHFSASSLHTTYKNSQGPQAGPLQGLVTFHPRSDHFVASMEPPHLHVSVGEAVW